MLLAVIFELLHRWTVLVRHAKVCYIYANHFWRTCQLFFHFQHIYLQGIPRKYSWIFELQINFDSEFSPNTHVSIYYNDGELQSISIIIFWDQIIGTTNDLAYSMLIKMRGFSWKQKASVPWLARYTCISWDHLLGEDGWGREADCRITFPASLYDNMYKPK